MDDDVEETAGAFLTTSRALLGIALRSVAAAPVPLTVPQHRLLVLVASDGPRRTGVLAEDLGVNQSNVSRLVDRLSSQGLVRRIPDPKDRRASLVDVTSTGRDVLGAVAELRLTELRRVVRGMPPESRRAAAAALRLFNEAAHEGDRGAR